jgi:DNA-binding LacI/PurR family transcriptional regulator
MGQKLDVLGRRATIREVARAAGVSPATVSQVLNGGRPVAEVTRARIEEIIAELGYRPNAFGRGLKTLRSHLVGIVLPDLSNPFYPALVRGVQDELGGSGYRAVIVNTDADRAQERELVSELISRQVDGLILITFTLDTNDLTGLVSSGTPAVVVGSAEGVDHVHTSDFSAALAMTTYLLEAGYARVAHLSGPEGAGPAPARMAGYRAAMSRHGLGEADQLVVHGDFTKPGGAKALARLAEGGQLPRAVFCANDMMALGAIEAAHGFGLSVPEDLAVAGFDDIDAASLVRPSLTTVGHSAGELGAKAAARLLDRIGGDDGPPVDIEVGFELKQRSSA